MKKFLAIVAILALTSCQSGMILVDAIGSPMRRVMDRHDEYVRADDSLIDLEKQIYLTDTELFRRILDAASGKEDR